MTEFDSSSLFDIGLLRQRRVRARRGEVADFLLRHVAEELLDRLASVTRTFSRAADIATPTDELKTRLRPVVPDIAHVDFGAGEHLALAPQSHDLAVSALALQFVGDLPGALAQIRRALKPDGLFLAAMIGGESLSELRQSFAAAEAEIDGGISPRVMPFADVRDLGALLQRAGFALPVTDVERLIVRYDTPLGLMHDLRAMGATNIMRARRRTPLKRATLARMMQIYGERFSDADGRVRATFDVVWLSGWAPHESQQQPLRPGSAKTRLADALGTQERKLKG